MSVCPYRVTPAIATRMPVEASRTEAYGACMESPLAGIGPGIEDNRERFSQYSTRHTAPGEFCTGLAAMGDPMRSFASRCTVIGWYRYDATLGPLTDEAALICALANVANVTRDYREIEVEPDGRVSVEFTEAENPARNVKATYSTNLLDGLWHQVIVRHNHAGNVVNGITPMTLARFVAGLTVWVDGRTLLLSESSSDGDVANDGPQTVNYFLGGCPLTRDIAGWLTNVAILDYAIDDSEVAGTYNDAPGLPGIPNDLNTVLATPPVHYWIADDITTIAVPMLYNDAGTTPLALTFTQGVTVEEEAP